MEDNETPDESLLDALEMRAIEAAADEDEAEAPDLVEGLAGRAPSDEQASAAGDVTLGGYVARHNRVPAFEGSDGQPYTVDVDVEDSGEGDGRFVGFLVFLRWAATGAGIMEHTESGDLSRGRSEEEARQAVMELSLYEVKAELDAAIARRRAELED